MAVKVSQATIDRIKQMGMTKALAGIKPTSGAEYKEAVRRMYGQRRLDAALGKSGATYKSADAARSAATSKTATPKYKTADAARMSSTSVTTSKPKVKTPKPKVTTSTSYVVGSRDPRVNAANAIEAISKGAGKKTKTPAQIAAEKAKKAAAEKAARLRSPNRGYSNR